jgi:hypothetical protein
MNFSQKYIFSFIIVFILFTPIGTITHELGHLFVAKTLGYETTLHYSSVNWNNKLVKNLWSQYERFKIEIDNNLDFEGHEQYKADVKMLNKHSLLICIGGVTQTIAFGLVAFILLIYRIIIKKENFTLFHWLLSFVSLFWLREVFNLISGIIKGFYLKNNIYFYGDEAKIARLLELHEGTLLLPLGIIAILISLMILKIIPNNRKKEFIIAALIGCPIGYILWMIIIGPIILS